MRDERGVVVVWTAILMTLLLAFVGWSVDHARWKREGARLQKAADAAALGGAVFMPENINSLAFTTAKDIAAKNRFAEGQSGVSIDTEQGKLPNQLKVTISETVENSFATIVGMDTSTITRHAVAEYQRPVAMGSPINQFGNDPQGGIVHGSATYPDFWANVFGPASLKQKGDAILATNCGATADNCSGSNTDADSDGYFYGIDVQPGSSGPLTVQAFDPAFANVGDNCGDDDHGSKLAAAAALPPNFNPAFPVADPATRYSAAPDSPYCTGDQYFDEGNNVVPWTVYKLRAPDLSPANPKNNPVICSIEFPGYLGDLAAALKAPTPQAGAPALFAAYFRQWYTLCTVGSPVVGTYFLEIETHTKVNGAAAPYGGGANRFAVRALLGSGSPRIYGSGHMGIYANAPAANTTFYLARVIPGAPGRTLLLSFYDVGDAAQPGALTVLPPSDSNVGSFGGCTYTPPPGNSTGPPWGTFRATGSNCTITNVSSATYNGQWIQYRIPIPDGYTCNYNDALGCWTKVRFAFPNNVSDTTTWSAVMEGDPVRIIE